MIDTILRDLIASVNGARAAIFLDGEGEAVSHAGETNMDLKLLGAWKEIHLDHIKEIANRLGLGNVSAVLFSQEDGNALIAPITGDYCLLLFLSSLSDVKDAIEKLKKALTLLKKDIE